MPPDNPNTDTDTIAYLEGLVSATPDNPAQSAPYPRGLALDLVLRTAPLPDLLKTYELTPLQAKEIMQNPAFRLEFDTLKDSIGQEGFAFKQKAAAQAEAYLELLWNMAHDNAVPSSVRADIVKNTVKWAALDQPAAQTGQNAQFDPGSMIQQLQNMPDQDLEVQILRIISKKAPKTVGSTFNNGVSPVAQALLQSEEDE